MLHNIYECMWVVVKGHAYFYLVKLQPQQTENRGAVCGEHSMIASMCIMFHVIFCRRKKKSK